MNVYTYWDSSGHAPKHQAELIRLWCKSWEARGWTPRILTVRNAQKHPRFKQAHPDDYCYLAFELVRGKSKMLVPSYEINFGYTPRDWNTRSRNISFFPSQGWEEASCVLFENCAPEVILNCGRKI